MSPGLDELLTAMSGTLIAPRRHAQPVTQWVESPEGGRERGPIGVLRAWVEVMVRPRRFFASGIAAGDQAPGLVFGVAVTLLHVVTRFALDPASVPQVGASPAVSALFALLAVAIFIAPLGLHLAAALLTVALILLVEERAGVSKTVQTVAYAAAPCALAGIPFEPTRLVVVAARVGLELGAVPFEMLRIAATGYGAVLLVVGLVVVHRISPARAAAAAAIPAAFVFGYGFGGFDAVVSLTGVTFNDLLALVASALQV